MSEKSGELIWLGSRKLRNLGNCYGFSIDRAGLEEAGLIDDKGDVPDDVSARIELYRDGKVVAEIEA